MSESEEGKITVIRPDTVVKINNDYAFNPAEQEFYDVVMDAMEAHAEAKMTISQMVGILELAKHRAFENYFRSER